MKSISSKIVFIFAHLFLTAACVSVNIPTGSGTRAKEVKFTSPEKPFSEINNAATDKAWISAKTANTISYLSECNNSSDPTLQQIENETLRALNKLNIVETKEFEFNGRNARSTVAEGEVDGVAVKTDLLIFKKNGCSFTLSYGGVLKHFESERRYFQKFTQTFDAL